ncbi:insulinase family protein [Clostridium sp. FP2]|uniref:M16 family metallopeptidase n=1 Tax=Clostridium sp. FP2 TaxID=2724481 RepID=UPI0013E999C8|nr:insulinase family protein [Clostridium sp. FP2]MBZ9626342.1 insulinase family protein [Clostridium sp. FP2]
MNKNNELIGSLKNGLTYYLSKNKFKKNAQLFLIIKAGSINENKKENGIAHLLEHMCLSYEKYCNDGEFLKNNLINIEPNQFDYSGYTDFDKTVLCIKSRENNCYTIMDGICILSEIVKGNILKEDIFETIKRDVIDECNHFREENLLKEKMVSFLTNNKITNLPMGNIDDISNMKFQDLLRFHNENFIPSEVGIIIQGNINLIKTQEFISGKFDSIKDNKKIREEKHNIKHSSNDRLLILNERKNKFIEIKFFYKFSSAELTIKDKLIKYFFENMIKNYVGCKFELYNLNIKRLVCSDKIIKHDFKFFILSYTIDKIKDSVEYFTNIINELKKNGFNKTEYQLEKNKLKNIMKQIYNESTIPSVDEIYESYFYNFLYNEPIFQIKKDYDLILSIIGKITIEDINNFMISLLNNCYNMIISQKDDFYN